MKPNQKRVAKAIAGQKPSDIVYGISMALRQLREARDKLRISGAAQAADYAGRAIKSAEGAMRHAERRQRDHVDTSDIPEVGEDWFKRARLQKKTRPRGRA